MIYQAIYMYSREARGSQHCLTRTRVPMVTKPGVDFDRGFLHLEQNSSDTGVFTIFTGRAFSTSPKGFFWVT